MNPYLVLLVSILLPSSGQVVNHQVMRAIIFLFFMVLMGAFTLKTASPDVSIIGKLAGGLFIYAISILDAYRTARVRFEIWHHSAGDKPGNTP